MKRLIVEPPLAFEEAAEWATDDELTAARGFAPARGREYLAWRAIVRREIGRDAVIAYNSAGAPILTNYPLHLSVSHCRGRAADCPKQVDGAERNSGHVDETGRIVGSGQIGEPGRVAIALSDAPCAVDIEPVARNFQRAVPRYLSPAEQRLSAHPHFPAIAWCAKESLFKYAASTTGRSLDLLRDLHIDRVQFPDGSDTTACSRPTPSRPTPVLSDGIPNGIPCGTLVARILDEEPVVLHFHEEQGFVVVFLFA